MLIKVQGKKKQSDANDNESTPGMKGQVKRAHSRSTRKLIDDNAHNLRANIRGVEGPLRWQLGRHGNNSKMEESVGNGDPC